MINRSDENMRLDRKAATRQLWRIGRRWSSVVVLASVYFGCASDVLGRAGLDPSHKASDARRIWRAGFGWRIWARSHVALLVRLRPHGIC